MNKRENHQTVLLTLEYPPQIGGISTYLSHLAERFPAGTFHVLAPELTETHVTDMAASVPIYRRPLIMRWLRPRWLPALYWTWWLYRKERPKVLIVSHLLNMGRVALNMRRLFKLPYVVILHGMDIALAASGGVNKRLAAKEILTGAAHIVCNSRYTAQWTRTLGIPENRITIVNPPPALPLDTAVEKSRADEFRRRLKIGDSFLLLSAGRLVERKGFDQCLEAVAELRGQKRNLKYVIVGEGAYREKLEQRAAELNITDCVQFLGATSTEELTTAYAACDTFVMVPRALGSDVEGFGIVYLEANLFGKPVIGSRSGGVPESVLHEETGLLVDPGNTPQLTQAIARLMDDVKLRERLGEGGRRRLQRDFGDDRQARRFVSAVRQAANSSPRNRGK
ncbi:MAG: glycosyltransferase family 4 protein [Patescibacteria group bacterium]